MANWNCSFSVPAVTCRPQIVEAGSPEEAALDYHDRNDDVGLVFHHETGGGLEKIYFALVLVTREDGQETTLVTRLYKHGLWRKGGVRVGTRDSLRDIAQKLNYRHDPATLVEPGWELEETMEEAQAKKNERIYGKKP